MDFQDTENAKRVRARIIKELDDGKREELHANIGAVTENLYQSLPSGDYGRGDVRRTIEDTLRGSRTWKLEVTIEVADTWVADGYEATPERVQRILEENDMTWTRIGDEYRVRVKTLDAPHTGTVRALQGYTD